MREGWKVMQLSELITTKKGYAFKSAWYEDKGVPVARVSDFTDNSISDENIFYINEKLALEHSSVLLNTKDIIVQTVGSWQHNPASIVGKVVRVPNNLNNSLLNQNAVKLIPNGQIEKDFLYYRLKDESFKYHNLNFAQGAANQASITLETIKCFKINLPPLETQKKIASILSGYDDLIENNLKRIKILEEMAQQTYEEWFVRMRFPGYESATINPETGLPEGWEKVKCFDAMEVLSGGTPKTNIDEYWNGNIEFYTPKDAKSGSYTNGSEKHITDLGLKKCNSKLYPKNTVFITARGTVGKLNLAAKPMAMNQSCYALVGKGFISQYFLFCSMNSIIETFKSASNGGVFNTIVVDTFKFLDYTIPTQDLIVQFEQIVISLYNSVFNLHHQNQRLREARDILLPRLMMGMVDV